MRARIIVTDKQGQTFEGEVDLVPATATRRGSARPKAEARKPTRDVKIDFGLARRAFLRKHARGSGPQKFAVLLAHMTGGKTTVQVTRADVETEWNRNRGVLGGAFRGMYATRAKEYGWTDSRKRGTFVLRAEWRVALAEDK